MAIVCLRIFRDSQRVFKGKSGSKGEGTAYLGGLAPVPLLEVKKIVLIFNVKKYAKF